MESRQTIALAEGHQETLAVASGGDECRLPLIVLSDANEVVCAPKVQPSEDGSTREGLQGGVSEWK